MNMKALINMHMSFSDILETLKYSVNMKEFQVSYYELIPEIAKGKNNSLNDWKIFMKDKNEMKNKFYIEYCSEYKNKYLRKLREAKYIYNINISEYLTEFENIINFKNRIKQLQ